MNQEIMNEPTYGTTTTTTNQETYERNTTHIDK